MAFVVCFNTVFNTCCIQPHGSHHCPFTLHYNFSKAIRMQTTSFFWHRPQTPQSVVKAEVEFLSDEVEQLPWFCLRRAHSKGRFFVVSYSQTNLLIAPLIRLHIYLVNLLQTFLHFYEDFNIISASLWTQLARVQHIYILHISCFILHRKST